MLYANSFERKRIWESISLSNSSCQSNSTRCTGNLISCSNKRWIYEILDWTSSWNLNLFFLRERFAVGPRFNADEKSVSKSVYCTYVLVKLSTFYICWIELHFSTLLWGRLSFQLAFRLNPNKPKFRFPFDSISVSKIFPTRFQTTNLWFST